MLFFPGMHKRGETREKESGAQHGNSHLQLVSYSSADFPCDEEGNSEAVDMLLLLHHKK